MRLLLDNLYKAEQTYKHENILLLIKYEIWFVRLCVSVFEKITNSYIIRHW